MVAALDGCLVNRRQFVKPHAGLWRVGAMAMNFLRWAAGLALAMTMFAAGSGANAASSGCQFVSVAELPVRFKNNKPWVPATIGGVQGWFLLDTGAQQSSLFAGATSAFRLDELASAYAPRIYGIGGEQLVREGVVPELTLDRLRIREFQVSILPWKGSTENSGIIGRDVLAQFDVEFDLADNKIRLWRATGCGADDLAYWASEAGGGSLSLGPSFQYEIEVSLNGRKIDAMLDSGSSTSLAAPNAGRIADLRQQDYSSETFQEHGIGPGIVTMRIATFQTLSVGSEQIHNAKLRIGDIDSGFKRPTTGSLIPQKIMETPSMILGADFLRSHRVLLAPQQHRIYFTYSGGPVFQIVGPAVQPKEGAPPPTPSPAIAASPPTSATPAH